MGGIGEVEVGNAASTFDLVCCDAAGIAQPLPAELGPLPLYPHDDGFYSVLGPPLTHVTCGDQANGSSNDTLACNQVDTSATVIPRRTKVFCGSSKCSGNRCTPPPTICLSFMSTNREKWPTHMLQSLLQLSRARLFPANLVRNEAGT